MKKIVLTYGIILGIIIITASTLNIFGHLGSGLSALLQFGPLILVFILACISYKKSQVEKLSFGNYLKLNGAITAFISVMLLIFNIGLVSTIDEERKGSLIDKLVTQQSEINKSMGISDDLIEAQIDAMYESQEMVFTIQGQFLGVIIVFFVYLLIAIIISAIMSKILKN